MTITIRRSLTLLAFGAILPSTASAQIGLQVRPDAPGTDERNLNGEWVIVSNEGVAPLELDGWTLCNAVAACFVFPGGVSIVPGGELKVHTGSGRNTLRAVYMGFERPIWANWADLAQLADTDGEVRARCMWDRGRGVDCQSTGG